MLEEKRIIQNIVKYSIPISENKILSKPKLPKQKSIINEERIKNMPYNNIILNFIDYITKNIDKDNLAIFYHNINKLIIKYNPEDKKASGEYNPIDNSILINKNKMEKIEEILPHELFHLFSIYYDKINDIAYAGFGQFSKKVGIGLGITEGYTQLLTERYLDHSITLEEDFFKTPYAFHTVISKNIEEIIGKEKMLKFYSNADLQSFIKELGKYTSSKEIIKFIMKLDYLYEKMYKTQNISIYETPFFLKAIKNQILFTQILKINKMIIDVKQGKITKQELNEVINSYISKVEDNKMLNNKNKEKIKSKVLTLKKTYNN